MQIERIFMDKKDISDICFEKLSSSLDFLFYEE